MNQPQQPYPFNFVIDRVAEDIPDFQVAHPPPFDNVDGEVEGAEGWTFLEFLDRWENNYYHKDLWWKYNSCNRIIHFEAEGRKLFLGIAEIVISFHENKKFSGNLVQRIRILPDLNVTHQSSPIEDEEAFQNGGQKSDIHHFRWMVAAVVMKAFPTDYHKRVSFHFRLFFSKIFTVEEGVKKYFVSQLYHPIFFNSSDRCSLIRMIRDLHDKNPWIFKSQFRLDGYGCRDWWLRINNRERLWIKDREVDDAFNRVLQYRGNYYTLYSLHPNSCTLPLYIRNVHEHFFKEGIDHENIDREINNLFPGISASIIDSLIRNFHNYWSEFGSTTILSKLQRTSPHGWCFPFYRYRN